MKGCGQAGGSIVLLPSAIDHLLADPMIRLWRNGADRRVPVLWYYRRCYSTALDGTVTEHGDGFGLTFVDPDDPDAMRDIVTKPVAVGSAFDILVGADEAMMSKSFAIGWLRKYIYEPRPGA